jgi:tetratricopeptide (TPR) repeat protein
MTATLADELAPEMGIPGRNPPDNVEQQNLSPDGARFYTEGLRAFTRLNLPVARVLLERATQTDPGYALAHLSLAETWSALGNEADAQKEAARAIALGRMRSAEARLRILATAAAISGHWDQAVRLDLTLANCWPGEQAYGVDLANALHQDRRDQEAKRILNSLHNLPAEEEVRRQLVLCEVDDALGDFQDEADTASKVMAAAQASKEGAPLARASLYRAGALEQLGQLKPASQLFVQAQSEADAAGDTATMMRASIGHAISVAQTGRPVVAAEQLQQTLALAQRVNAKPEQLRCLLALGAVYRETKALDLSLAASGQAIVLAQHLGRQRDLAAAHLSMGQTENYLGHTAKAREELDDALSEASATNDAPLKVGALGTLGQLDYMQGDLRTSSTLLQHAVQMGVSAGARELAARYMGQLSQVLSYQARDGEAMQVLDRLCAYARSARDSIYLLNCELYQSQANEQAGHDQVAKNEIDQILSTSHDPLVTAEAYRQLTFVFLHEGDVSSALRAIGKAQAESRGMLNEEDYLIPIGIAAARVEAATGELQPALAHLSTLRQRTIDLNVTELELEAEYASDETELGLDAARGIRDLQAFQVKANGLGFLSFARQAAERIQQQQNAESGKLVSRSTALSR